MGQRIHDCPSWNDLTSQSGRKATVQSGDQSPIPFDTLVEAIRKLGPHEKRWLWEMLSQELTRAEQELAEQDLTLRGEVREIREDRALPDYLSSEP
jgi:hypothetical protein